MGNINTANIEKCCCLFKLSLLNCHRNDILYPKSYFTAVQVSSKSHYAFLCIQLFSLFVSCQWLLSMSLVMSVSGCCSCIDAEKESLCDVTWKEANNKQKIKKQYQINERQINVALKLTQNFGSLHSLKRRLIGIIVLVILLNASNPEVTHFRSKGQNIQHTEEYKRRMLYVPSSVSTNVYNNTNSIL